MLDKRWKRMYLKVAQKIVEKVAKYLPSLPIGYPMGRITRIFFDHEECLYIAEVLSGSAAKKSMEEWQNLFRIEIDLCDSFLSREGITAEDRFLLWGAKEKIGRALSILDETGRQDVYEFHAAKLAIDDIANWSEEYHKERGIR